MTDGDWLDYWRFLTRCLWRGHRFAPMTVEVGADGHSMGNWTFEVCEHCHHARVVA